MEAWKRGSAALLRTHDILSSNVVVVLPIWESRSEEQDSWADIMSASGSWYQWLKAMFRTEYMSTVAQTLRGEDFQMCSQRCKRLSVCGLRQGAKAYERTALVISVLALPLAF